MKSYKPGEPFNTALKLLAPAYTTSYGVPTKTFQDIEHGALFFGSFKSYGGTEVESNGIISVQDTAIIETWYRPDIKSNSKIAVLQTGEVYEVLGKPENIQMRNQYLRFKVQLVTGGA